MNMYKTNKKLLFVVGLLVFSIILQQIFLSPAIFANRISTAVIFSTVYNTVKDKAFILFVGHRDYFITFKFLCHSQSNFTSMKSNPTIHYVVKVPFDVCLWTQYVAACDTVDHMVSIQIETGNLQFVNLPFRETVQKSYDVVVCISPFYLYERWQQLVAAIEIWHHYGAGKQVIYVMNMLETVYNLLKAYEKSGIVHVVMFPNLPILENEVNPNTEIESRNLAGAYTDCLYWYQEAAKFIIFADADDILVPQLGKSFMDEFLVLSETFPSASVFRYQRQHLDIFHDSTGKPLDQFRFDSIHIKGSNCRENVDTKYAAIPERILSAWIHWPGRSTENFTEQILSCSNNTFLHFRNWIQLRPNTDQGGADMKIFEKEAIEEMDAHYQQVIFSGNMSHVTPHNGEQYYPYFEKCFSSENFSKKYAKMCLGVYLCQIPRITVKCVHMNGTYDIIFANTKVRIGLLRNYHLVVANSCND